MIDFRLYSRLSCGEILNYSTYVEKFQISSHLSCGEIWNYSTCGEIPHRNFSCVMHRNLKLLHMKKFLPSYICGICDKYQVCTKTQPSFQENIFASKSKLRKFMSTSFRYFCVCSYLICPPPYISSCYRFWIPGIRPVFEIISDSCSVSDAGRLEQITSGRTQDEFQSFNQANWSLTRTFSQKWRADV